MVAKTDGTCIATVPFLQFTIIVKDIQPAETEIIITEGLLKLINEAELKLKEKIKQAHLLLKP